MYTRTALPASLIALFALACSGGSGVADSADTGDSACTPDGTGTLQLDLSAPALPDPISLLQKNEAVVYGPDGVEVGRSDESITLTDLPGGQYTVVILRAEEDGAGLTGAAWGAPSQTVYEVCVGNDTVTTVAAAWELHPGAGRLWASSGESLVAFQADQVAAGGEQAADIRMDVAYINDFRGFAFDRMGNLWAAASPTYGSRLLWFSPDQQTGVGEVEPAGELSAPIFDDFAPISDLVFDDTGALWVAVRKTDGSFSGLAGWEHGAVEHAIATGGALVVEPDQMRPVDGLMGKVDLEVDSRGSIWITDYDADRLVRIDDPRDGATAPDLSLRVSRAGETPIACTAPENVSFRDDGAMDVLFWSSGEMARIPAADLRGSGDVDLMIAGTDVLDVLDLPRGMVVDGAGNTILGNYSGSGAGELLQWTPGSTPRPVLSSLDMVDPADLVLNPAAR